MGLAAISSHISWSTLRTTYNHFNRWCPVALIVMEMALRWQMTKGLLRVLNSEELRAERYQELTQSLILSGAALYQSSTICLATITVVALGRLYGTLKVVPWIRGLTLRESMIELTLPLKTYFDVAYLFLEVLACINLAVQVCMLSLRSPLRGLVSAGISFALPTLISQVFQHLLKKGYWDLKDARLVILKLERMKSVMISLQLIRTACVFGLLGIAERLAIYIPPETDKGAFRALFSMICSIGGLFGAVWFFFRYYFFALLYNGSFAASYALASSHLSERNLFIEMTYHYSVDFFGDYYDTFCAKLIKTFNSNILNQKQKETLFIVYSCLFLNSSINILKESPDCFTHNFLITCPNLWNLDINQIKAYLLPPEVKLLLQKAIVTNLEVTLKILTEQIDSLEKVGEKSFTILRPLRERLEIFSFAKANDFLSRVPQSPKPAVAILTQLKTKVQQLENQVFALEQRLETLCEDLKPAYEAIPHFREDDMKKVLEQTGISAEGQYCQVLFNLLATWGIKWKGDLAQVLQKGDNTNERLIEQMVKFIKEHH